MSCSLFKLLLHPRRLFHRNTYSSEVFVDYLRKKGAKIGKNTRFINPERCHVDPGRMDYIQIGDNCCLVYATLLAHDYSWYVFAGAYGDVLPDPGGDIKIGNNCFIGYEACILKGTTIGDNVIIGARAVVKGNIPSNTVWGGVPAKQICTLQELYEKKLNCRIQDAIKRREHIKDVYHRDPTIEEMGFFSFLFLKRTEENYLLLKNYEFNGIKDDKTIRKIFFSTVPLYNDFNSFLDVPKDSDK